MFAPAYASWRTTLPHTISVTDWSVRPRSSCPATCRSATTGCTRRPARSRPARPLIVAPAVAGAAEALGDRRTWGLATQLYSVRSGSPGASATWPTSPTWRSGRRPSTAPDFVLVNPLHAAEPIAPMEPSPYLPTSRRFVNPLYLRVERIPEYAWRRPATAAAMQRIEPSVRRTPAPTLIDRDTAWTAKRAALRERLSASPRSAGRELAYAAYCAPRGPRPRRLRHLVRARRGARRRLASTGRRSCASRRRRGRRLRAPSTPTPSTSTAGCSGSSTSSSPRHSRPPCGPAWRSASCTTSRSACTRAAPTRGRCRTCSRSASPWARRRTSSTSSARTGSQPPWRPDRLAEHGYAPFRDLVAAVLRHAGGMRVDHIIGLFRLWWIPKGGRPTEGTYVRYDHEAMIGILALEAHRAGAVVVGEDLGTVEPWVRDYLPSAASSAPRSCGSSSTATATAARCAAERWREYCLASVTTHDLPPTAGYLAGEHVRLRDRLGLLTRPVEEELAADAAERQAWLGRAAGARAAAVDGRRRRGDGRGAAPLPRSAPRRGCSALRWPTPSATGAPRTSRARPTSTPTGGSRLAAPTGADCCSKTCSPTRARMRSPRPCGPPSTRRCNARPLSAVHNGHICDMFAPHRLRRESREEASCAQRGSVPSASAACSARAWPDRPMNGTR